MHLSKVASDALPEVALPDVWVGGARDAAALAAAGPGRHILLEGGVQLLAGVIHVLVRIPVD